MKKFFSKNNSGAISAYDRARGFFVIFFLAVLGIYAAVNFIVQGPWMLGGIKEIIAKSKSLSEAKNNIAEFEKTVGGAVLGGSYFVDGYAWLQKLMAKEETDNFWVIRDKRGGLSYANFYSDDDSNIEECVRRLRRLQSDAARGGTRVFFVNPPAHHVRGQSTYSSGLPYADHNFLQDAFLYQLGRYGVEYIDLRESLPLHKNLNPIDYFFLTDHHWKTETAFAAFADIISWMNTNFDAGLDPRFFYRDLNNYNLKQYPKAYLGSMGRAAGANFSGLDDFTVIWPKFDSETDFTLEARFLESYRPEPARGVFTRALMRPEYLTTEDPYAVDFYAVYLGGIKLSDRIINHGNPDGPKLLLIYDSYLLPVSVFMAPLFSEIQMIWHSADSGRIDIDSYLKTNSFDYIIVEMYQENLKPESFYFYRNPAENE